MVRRRVLRHREPVGATGRAVLLVVAVVVAVTVLVLGGVHVLGGAGSPTRAPASSAASPSPSRDPSGPRYPVVLRTAAVIGARTADVYLPVAASAGLAVRRLPVLLLRPARGVDATQYAELAHDLGGYGLVVVVPPSPSHGDLRDVSTWMRHVDGDPSAPAQGLVDPAALVVVEHGSTPQVSRGSSAPAALAALSPEAGAKGPTPQGPILVVGGDPDPGAATAYRAMRGRPRALASIAGLGPLGVTDDDRRGPRSGGELAPARAARIALVARLTAWWVLGALGDPAARTYFAGPPPSGVVVVHDP